MAKKDDVKEDQDTGHTGEELDRMAQNAPQAPPEGYVAEEDVAALQYEKELLELEAERLLEEQRELKREIEHLRAAQGIHRVDSHWVSPTRREHGDPFFVNVSKDKAKEMIRSGQYQLVYFIVNPAGAIHNVNRENARRQLKRAGFRLAKPEEVQRLLDAKGYQRADRPICEPFQPDPGLDIELD